MQHEHNKYILTTNHESSVCVYIVVKCIKCDLFILQTLRVAAVLVLRQDHVIISIIILIVTI